MTPAEFEPYISAKIKTKEDELKMENERVGLICATLQNGIPIGYIKKGAKQHHPTDYFRQANDGAEEASNPQHIFDVMSMWCSATRSRVNG